MIALVFLFAVLVSFAFSFGLAALVAWLLLKFDLLLAVFGQEPEFWPLTWLLFVAFGLISWLTSAARK